MARARNIKPKFFKNYELADHGPHAQLLFAGLWVLADREGRLEDKPRFIKAEVFPYYDVDVNGVLTLLNESGFVKRYMVNRVPYIQIINFKKHQSPHSTEKGSEIPSMDDADPELKEEIVVKSMLHEINGSLTVESPKHNDGNPPDSLIPLTLIPDSLIPDSPTPESLPLPPGKPAAKKKQEPDSSATWRAFNDAYFHRYGIEPVRNASVNSKMAQFVQRIGVEESPHVAAFYVQHNSSNYVRASHSVGLLLVDCEGLRTQWATNSRMTVTKAIQQDRTQTNADVFNKLIAEQQEKERNGNGVH